MSPSAFAQLLNRFYETASNELLGHDAIIDKMVGDEVMALFFLGPTGRRYRQAAVHAAVGLIRALGYADGKPWLPVGIGVHAGLAYVGKVGTSEINDFTALGDTVNTAARLQAEAQPGEVVIGESLYGDVASDYPGLEQRTLTLKGKEEPVSVRVLRPGPAPVDPPTGVR